VTAAEESKVVFLLPVLTATAKRDAGIQASTLPISYHPSTVLPVPVAARSKAQVFGRSPAEIVGSSPKRGHGCFSVVIVVCQVEVSATSC